MTLASRLNRRVVILQRSTTTDTLGQPTEGWTEVQTVWGDVRYQTGLRTLSADELHGGARASIRIRQTACSLGITAGMRARVGLTEFNITAALPQGTSAIDLVCQQL